MLHSLRYRQ